MLSKSSVYAAVVVFILIVVPVQAGAYILAISHHNYEELDSPLQINVRRHLAHTGFSRDDFAFFENPSPLRASPLLVLLTFHGDKLVAVLAYHRQFAANAFSIDSLNVECEFQRIGIATRMLSMLDGLLAKTVISGGKISLRYNNLNHGAKALYRKNGFKDQKFGRVYTRAVKDVSTLTNTAAAEMLASGVFYFQAKSKPL